MKKANFTAINLILLLISSFSFSQSGYTVAPSGSNGIIIRLTAATVNKPFKGIISGFNWLRDIANEKEKNRFIKNLISDMQNVSINEQPNFWRINYYTEPSGAKKMGHITKFGEGSTLEDAFVDNYKSPSLQSTPPKLPFEHGLFIKIQKTENGIIIQEFILTDSEIKSNYINARRKARKDIIAWSKNSAAEITSIEDIYPAYLNKSLKRNNKVKRIARKIEAIQNREKLLLLNKKYSELEYKMKTSLEKYVKNQKKLQNHMRVISVANLLLSVASASNSIYQSGENNDLEMRMNSLSEDAQSIQADLGYLKSSVNNMHHEILEINQNTILIINANDFKINIDYPSEPPLVQ
ncbi:hypothetical protein ABN763_10105 [Spongiivirga sp. MCCC 1A20706]|uniref:hypothetical protein n=1 Tax=Spongiivirga sp. MCCC 1A20706 TaxID=3160963 RepID=UPI003977D139